MCSCALWSSTTTVQKLLLRCSSLKRAWHPSTEVSSDNGNARRARRGRRGCLCTLHAHAQRAWACRRVWVCADVRFSSLKLYVGQQTRRAAPCTCQLCGSGKQCVKPRRAMAWRWTLWVVASSCWLWITGRIDVISLSVQFCKTRSVPLRHSVPWMLSAKLPLRSEACPWHTWSHLTVRGFFHLSDKGSARYPHWFPFLPVCGTSSTRRGEFC